MLHEIVISGFGGQGVMVAGQLLAHTGMVEGKHVAWIPSYGPEMRGGTANCTVIIADEPVGSPIVTNPGIVLAMNGPSLDKYERLVQPGGLLLYNCSIVERKPRRADITVVAVPCDEEAIRLGNQRLANSVMLGALVGCTGILPLEGLAASVGEVLSARQHHLVELNRQALQRGLEIATRAMAGAA
jgi:2-oxoglutarate ferredoxin oxidoreductase subunit gamma